MPTKRSVQATVTFIDDKGQVELKIKRIEHIKAEDGSEFHSEAEGAKQEFAQLATAIDAATLEFKNFASKATTAPSGELFA